MNGVLRSARIILQILVVTLILLPPHLLACAFNHPLRRRIPVLWHRLAAYAFSLRIRLVGNIDHTVGKNPTDAGRLIVANHASWLDIVVLGSLAPVSFIAKSEVRKWPIFGQLARLQDSVFVQREVRTKVREQASQIAGRLSAGDNLVLFAEGTTSDGNTVYPFNSSLFGAIGIVGPSSKQQFVQPVAIVYTGWYGLPMGRFDRPIAAWPGTIGIGPHLLRILREGVIDVAVICGEVITVDHTTNRKQLTRQCEAAVREMMSEGLRGRLIASHH